MAIQDSQESSSPVVRYLGRVVLDKSLLPPYTPRKALCRKSFTVHDACTYVFGLNDHMPKRGDASGDRDAATNADGKRSVAPWPGDGLLPVTTDLILSLREQFLSSYATSADAPRNRAKRRKGPGRRNLQTI